MFSEATGGPLCGDEANPPWSERRVRFLRAHRGGALTRRRGHEAERNDPHPPRLIKYPALLPLTYLSRAPPHSAVSIKPPTRSENPCTPLLSCTDAVGTFPGVRCAVRSGSAYSFWRVGAGGGGCGGGAG